MENLLKKSVQWFETNEYAAIVNDMLPAVTLFGQMLNLMRFAKGNDTYGYFKTCLGAELEHILGMLPVRLKEEPLLAFKDVNFRQLYN